MQVSLSASFPRKNVTPADSKPGRQSHRFELNVGVGLRTTTEAWKCKQIGPEPGFPPQALVSAGVTFFRGNDSMTNRV